jgi:hypothetical protein
MTFLKINSNNRAIWLDFIEYANLMFNQEKQNIWSNPVTFLSVYGQGQSLLHSDVISIPLKHFYTNYLKEHPDEIEALKGKKLKIAVKKILSLVAPKQIIQEVLKGICHLYKDKQPILLTIPSPQLLLREACGLIGGNSGDIDENLLDAASMYLAELLRSFSEAGLSGIVVEESTESILPFPKIDPLYQPFINVAHHYQWLIGYWGKSSEIGEVSFSNFSISPNSNQYTENSVCLLQDTWWTETTDDSLIPDSGIVFTTIPSDAIPELVLKKLNEIRMTAKSN